MYARLLVRSKELGLPSGAGSGLLLRGQCRVESSSPRMLPARRRIILFLFLPKLGIAYVNDRSRAARSRNEASSLTRAAYTRAFITFSKLRAFN